MRLPVLLSTITLFAIASCRKQEPTALNYQKPQSAPAAQEDNLIISSEPLENVSLEDYWDEARSIRSEAQQILQRSAETSCREAHQMATISIQITHKAEKSHNFQESEALISNANDALTNAEAALNFCENRTEIEDPLTTQSETASR